MKQPDFDIDHFIKVFELSETSSIFGSGVSMPTKLLIMHGLKLGEIDDILNEPNAEVRRHLITFYGVERFLRDGGAEEFLGPKGPDDYQFARVLRLTFGDTPGRRGSNEPEEYFYVEMINQTIEPGAENMTVEQRLAANLDEEGRKKYYNLILPEQAKAAKSMWDIEAWTFGRNLVTGEMEGFPEELMPFFDFNNYQPDVES